MDAVFLVAVTGVLAGEGLKAPGAVFQASADVAAELLDAGAARPAEPDEIPESKLMPTAEGPQDAQFKRPA